MLYCFFCLPWDRIRKSNNLNKHIGSTEPDLSSTNPPQPFHKSHWFPPNLEDYPGGWFSGDRITPIYFSHGCMAIWKGSGHTTRSLGEQQQRSPWFLSPLNQVTGMLLQGNQSPPPVPPTWPKRSTLLALNSRSSSSTKRCMALEGDGLNRKTAPKTHRKPVGNALFFFRGYRSWMYPYEKSLYKPLYFVGIYGLVIIPKNPIQELLIDTMGTLLGVHPIALYICFYGVLG